MKMPDIKPKNIINKIKGEDKPDVSEKRYSEHIEKAEESKLLLTSLLAIFLYIVIAWVAVVLLSDEGPEMHDVLRGSIGSVFSLIFAVIIMDRIHARNDKIKRKRDERRAVIRHNKIIQPVLDMYLVRKNMVITPNEKTVRKFQIKSSFTIKDMKDMYGPSELISDVGKSKVEVYAFYQERLHYMFTHLVEDVDFNFYSELCDAAMDYINATSYGASALEAVTSYQSTLTGTKSMKSVVLNMIKEEPDSGKFVDAPPALKNVYLVHQMINDQGEALGRYLKLVQVITKEDDRELGKNAPSKADYE